MNGKRTWVGPALVDIASFPLLLAPQKEFFLWQILQISAVVLLLNWTAAFTKLWNLEKIKLPVQPPKYGPNWPGLTITAVLRRPGTVETQFIQCAWKERNTSSCTRMTQDTTSWTMKLLNR